MSLQSNSYFIESPDKSKLHLLRINTKENLPAVICIHGAFDSGRIFYNKKLTRGFAPFLAEKGFDVFVADLRGHGESTPKISKNSRYGMHENIREDIPLFIEKIKSLKGPECSISVVTHSDGGILFFSSYAFSGGFKGNISNTILLGAKREVTIKSLKRVLFLEFMWYGVVPIILRIKGYLPAKALKIGGQDDSRLFTEQRTKWLKRSEWIDPVDRFHYGVKLKELTKPRTLFIASSNDPVLGHPIDVERFKTEISNGDDELLILSAEGENLHNYDHVSMLTHKDADKDHFPHMVKWLKK
ncbi:MAG: alpha/beta fold hydrolase [Proteobacteria bacterium]|nr:alpha/beta fold hydrolase [Pseudomonadota bacterium]